MAGPSLLGVLKRKEKEKEMKKDNQNKLNKAMASPNC